MEHRTATTRTGIAAALASPSAPAALRKAERLGAAVSAQPSQASGSTATDAAPAQKPKG